MGFNCKTNPFDTHDILTDSAVFNYVGRVILHGGMPYRDTFDHKGPLIYLIDAFGQFINSEYGVWIVEVVFFFGLFYFSYKIAQLMGCGELSSMLIITITMISLYLYFEGGNLTEEYGCFFIMVGLFVFIKYFREEKISRIYLILCGFSFGAVCMLRINMISLWMVMCVAVVVNCIRKKKAGELPGFIIWFFTGTGIMIVPIFIWLIVNDAFIPFIDDYFVFNLTYTSDPVQTSFENMRSVVHGFLITAPVVMCISMSVLYCLKEKKIWDILTGISIVVSLVMICISGRPYMHYAMVMVPFVTYEFSRFFGAVAGKREYLYAKTACICAVVLLFAPTLNAFHAGLVNTIYVNQEDVATADETVSDIIKNNTSEDDLISVCDNRDALYVLSGRMSASIYSYQHPIAHNDPGIIDRYVADLSELRAKMIIIGIDSFLHGYIDGILAEHYTLIDTVENSDIYLLNQVS